MIRISQVKLPVGHAPEALEQKAAQILRIRPEEMGELHIRKRSLDARKRPPQYVYELEAEVSRERQILKRVHGGQVTLARHVSYQFPEAGSERMKTPPVIVGSGPAGLFCGLMLARAGYAPVILERGQQARERKKTVDAFWQGGSLDPNSNVQFGEGGAGTFSDGKLNTLVKDPRGRGRKALELLVEAGAPEEILYESKPHLGTDLLVGIVEHIRKEIEALGGKVLFGHQLVDICVEDGRVQGVRVKRTDWAEKPVEAGCPEREAMALGEKVGGTGPVQYLDTQTLVLAIGHSARDTFSMLKGLSVPMEPKAFAVGVRIEHPQEMIDRSRYGEDYPQGLPAAAYKLTRKVADGRGVYSFCMCPGGYVVNASSEEGRLAVNGMSYQARDGRNANSAMIVTVRPEDFENGDALAGVEFQRRLEERAYRAGNGRVPVQLLEDFVRNRITKALGDVSPCIKGAYAFGDVRGIFPEQLQEALQEGILGCGQVIPGFVRPDAVLSGVESRTSSPVRILRDDNLESGIKGLFPCGEGAGYAGGITSAAMDGIRVAEEIRKRFCPG